jgi:hypothetical protein
VLGVALLFVGLCSLALSVLGALPRWAGWAALVPFWLVWALIQYRGLQDESGPSRGNHRRALYMCLLGAASCAGLTLAWLTF